MQEAALINTSVSDQRTFKTEVKHQKAPETTDNSSALEYDQKQHGRKFDSEVRGRSQEQDEQKCLDVLTAKNLAQDSSHWKKS